MNDSKLLTINGITGRYWPLILCPGGKEENAFNAGYYFDNPRQPGFLKQYHFSSYNEEDDKKTGRIYIIPYGKLTPDQLQTVCEFRNGIGDNSELYCTEHEDAIRKPTESDLLIYAVESGITDPILLRTLANRIKHFEANRIEAIFPDAKRQEIGILSANGIFYNIISDGSCHS